MPTYFLNWKNGVNYSLVTQAPQYDTQSLQDLQNIPITAPTATRPEILADVASITRNDEMGVVNHYNIRRVIDLYASVQDRALGATARDIDRVIAAYRPQLPRGSFITLRGQIDTMNRSYADGLRAAPWRAQGPQGGPVSGRRYSTERGQWHRTIGKREIRRLLPQQAR